MRIIFFLTYMILGLFSANQLRIGLVKNARQSGVDTAPLRSRKFKRLLIALVFLFTGLPFLAVRFVPNSQLFAVFVYALGFFAITGILTASPSQPELGWAMLAYAVAAVISGYHAYLTTRFEFFSSVLAAAAAGLLLVGIFHFLRQKAEEDDDEEDIESAADSAMLEAAKAVITPSRVLTVLLVIACLVAGKFLLQQLGIM
jgi:hypothetical protein